MSQTETNGLLDGREIKIKQLETDLTEARRSQASLEADIKQLRRERDSLDKLLPSPEKRTFMKQQRIKEGSRQLAYYLQQHLKQPLSEDSEALLALLHCNLAEDEFGARTSYGTLEDSTFFPIRETPPSLQKLIDNGEVVVATQREYSIRLDSLFYTIPPLILRAVFTRHVETAHLSEDAFILMIWMLCRVFEGKETISLPDTPEDAVRLYFEHGKFLNRETLLELEQAGFVKNLDTKVTNLGFRLCHHSKSAEKVAEDVRESWLHVTFRQLRTEELGKTIGNVPILVGASD